MPAALCLDDATAPRPLSNLARVAYGIRLSRLFSPPRNPELLYPPWLERVPDVAYVFKFNLEF